MRNARRPVGTAIAVSAAIVLLVVLAVILVSRTPPTSTTASPSGTASAGASTSATPSATASPTAAVSASPSASVARPGIVVTAAGAIPADHAFILITNTGAERVLLLDLAAKKSREVVRFDRPQSSSRSVVLTDSADGQTLAILERTDGGTLLHVVKPVTGDLRTFPQPEGIDGPNIAPDGSRVAVSRKSSEPALNGLWTLPVDGSVGTRIIAEDPAAPGSPPQPRAWSIDGRWLAAFASGAAGQQIIVMDTRAGATTFSPTAGLTGGDARAVPGIDAVWRGAEVLVWTSRTAPGTPTVTSYDAVTRVSAPVFTAGADQNIIDVVPRPSTRQVAVRVAPFANLTPSTPHSIVLVDPAAATRTLAIIALLNRLWWSPDGAHLYVRSGGDDSVGGVGDIFGTWGSMTFCLRGGDPPNCT